MEIRELNILDIKPNLYKITDNGFIINSKNKIAKTFISNSGYERINLMSIYGKSKNYSIHRLVALMFVDNPFNYPIVNHIDGNKLNNDFSNLEWISYIDNWNHAHEVINSITNIGETAYNRKANKYPIELVYTICELLSEHRYKSNEIIKKLNLIDPLDVHSVEYIRMKKFIKNIRQRRCWKDISKNYTWA